MGVGEWKEEGTVWVMEQGGASRVEDYLVYLVEFRGCSS